jgi:diamine N-acetyltransferase
MSIRPAMAGRDFAPALQMLEIRRSGPIARGCVVVLDLIHDHGSSSPKLLRAAHIAAVTTMFVKQPPRVGCSQWMAYDAGGSNRSQTMSPSISIRPAVQADIPSLVPLFEVLDEHHRIALPEVFRKPAGARREESWLDWIMAGPDRAILVAEGIDREIIGLVVLILRSVPAIVVRDARRFVEIDQLVVGAGARGSGVGRSLIDASKAWAQKQGISQLEVSAWSFNVEAVEFYRKLGFHRIVERFATSSD